MRVLVLGAGGREHALCWKLRQSARLSALFAAPGNGGMDSLATCVRLRVDDLVGVCDLVRRERIDLTVVGPEAALVAGVVDALSAQGSLAFGPTRAAAALEGSKAFARQFMREAGIVGPEFAVFSGEREALAYVDAHRGPLVVKADGLAAGKGVAVCDHSEAARQAIHRMLAEEEFGSAGLRVVIEERLVGREVSCMALCDGERVALLASAEDYKQVFDHDQGPNTGGMGSCSPSPVLSAAEQRQVLEEVLLPTVREMRARGCDYRGLLYAGLMLVPGRGPLVLEFNCRLGDPETQPVLARWRGDLLPWLVGAARGCLPEGEPAFDPRVAVCVVLASRGYPGPYAQGHAIHGLAEAETLPGVAVFHAGTRWEGERCLTAGGRVLGVTAVDDDLVGARARAYEAVSRIQFVDMHYRRDIGQRGMQGERR